MDYHKKYLKYKAKYLELRKIQQTGGRNFTREEYQEYINKADTASAEAYAKQIASEFGPDLGSAIQNPFAERDSSLPTSVPAVSKPSAPVASSSSSPSRTITKTIYSPVYLSSRLRPGDRVMKVQYTSDNLSGMLGDKGTVHSVDVLTNMVAVQFDRYYPQRLLSYVPSYVLEVIYDPMPYSYPRRRPAYDDDDDDLYEEEEERKPRRKASKKKASKKSSKKASKKRSRK